MGQILTTIWPTNGSEIVASNGATPSKIIFPWLAVNEIPSSIKATTPVASIVIVVPFPDVISRILSAKVIPSPSLDVSIVLVDPKLWAISKRFWNLSMPMMTLQPEILAPWKGAEPSIRY